MSASLTRRRVIPEDLRFLVFPGTGGIPGSVLVDGFLRATWRLTRGDSDATVAITPLANGSRGRTPTM